MASAAYNEEGGPLHRAELLPGSFGHQSLNLTGDVGFDSSFASCAPEGSNGVDDSASFTIELNMWMPLEGHSYSFDLADIACLADLGIVEPAIPLDPNRPGGFGFDTSMAGSVANFIYRSGTGGTGQTWLVPETAGHARVNGILSVNASYVQCPGQPGPIIEGVPQPTAIPITRDVNSEATVQTQTFSDDELRASAAWTAGDVSSLIPVLFGSSSSTGATDTMTQDADHSISVKPNQAGGHAFHYCLVDPVSLTSAMASGIIRIEPDATITAPEPEAPNEAAVEAPRELPRTGLNPLLFVAAFGLTVIGLITMRVGSRQVTIE
ncbi:MAG: hypothetical protein WED09_05430 [Homoserinimonas sp.]